MTPDERWAIKRLMEAADIRAQYLESDEGMADDELEDINKAYEIVLRLLRVDLLKG